MFYFKLRFNWNYFLFYSGKLYKVRVVVMWSFFLCYFYYGIIIGNFFGGKLVYFMRNTFKKLRKLKMNNGLYMINSL